MIILTIYYDNDAIYIYKTLYNLQYHCEEIIFQKWITIEKIYSDKTQSNIWLIIKMAYLQKKKMPRAETSEEGERRRRKKIKAKNHFALYSKNISRNPHFTFTVIHICWCK